MDYLTEPTFAARGAAEHTPLPLLAQLDDCAWISVERAAERLTLTPDFLMRMASANGWVLHSRRGELHVLTRVVEAFAEFCRVPEHPVAAEARLLAVQYAVHELLTERFATGEWEVAREEQRPLIAGRRGGPGSYGDIEHHTVAIRCTWLPRLVGQPSVLHREDERAKVMQRWMPTSSITIMSELGKVGFQRIAAITPLFEPGRPRRGTDWVRLPTDYARIVKLDERTSDAIHHPWDREAP